MDAVRLAIRSWLLGDPVLVALLADAAAIYHETAPRDALTPYVVFQRQAGTEKHTFAAGGGESQMWLVKAIQRGPQADRAEDLDSQIRARLDLAELVVDGKTTQSIRRESRVEYPEADGAETFHHVGALYRVDVQPAT